MTEGHTLGHKEGGKELTPHCLVIACCNRNKQNPALPRDDPSIQQALSSTLATHCMLG